MSILIEQELLMRLSIIRRVLDLNRDQLRQLAQSIEQMFPTRPESVPLPDGLPDLVPIADVARMLVVNAGHLKRRASRQWTLILPNPDWRVSVPHRG